MRDPTSIAFFVLGVPRTKNARKAAIVGGHARVVHSKESQKREQAFRVVAQQSAPPKPLEKPLVLSIRYYFPIPKAARWKTQAAKSGCFQKATNPDLDNLTKLVLDAMQGIFFRDDAQIVSLMATKLYHDVPRTEVQLAEFEDHVESAREWSLKKQELARMAASG